MRLRSILISLGLLAGFAGPAHSAGMNLSWNDCGNFGLPLETFACNTNVGVHRLFASFVSPVPTTQLVGTELSIYISFRDGVVPNWWSAPSSGAGCRVGLGIEPSDVSGPYSCVNPWTEQAGGAASITPDVPWPGRALLRALVWVPATTPRTIDDVTEYYGIQILINHTMTTGTGACTGCEVPACLQLGQLWLYVYQPSGVSNYLINQPLDNVIAGWQCAALYGSPDPQCFLCPVPSRERTWGEIKTLYR